MTEAAGKTSGGKGFWIVLGILVVGNLGLSYLPNLVRRKNNGKICMLIVAGFLQEIDKI